MTSLLDVGNFKHPVDLPLPWFEAPRCNDEMINGKATTFLNLVKVFQLSDGSCYCACVELQMVEQIAKDKRETEKKAQEEVVVLV